jgi:hypothetical protein
MNRTKLLAAATAAVVLSSVWSGTASAFARRKVHFEHAYHTGYHFIPPASAWDPVKVRPPLRYGAPMYYFPGSYLSRNRAYYPPAHHPHVSSDRLGGAWISIHARHATYAW